MMPPQLLELYAQPSQMWGGVDPEKNQRDLSSQMKSDLFFFNEKIVFQVAMVEEWGRADISCRRHNICEK